MADVEYRRMQQIRGSRAEFEAINPILYDGELAIQQTDRIIKAGTKDRRPWSELPEFTLDWSNIRNIPDQVGQTGEKGDAGADGKSAYELYLDAFTAEHADDVVDEEHPVAQPLSQAEWLASLSGSNGESAFQIAERLGLATGSEEDWIRSLHGEKGEKGDNGAPFAIKKIFASADAMAQAGSTIITPAQGVEGDPDYVPEETLAVGDFVIIITEDIEEDDYGKLYIYEGKIEGADSYRFIVDMALPGATGIQGPQGEKGDTGETGASAYQLYVKNFNEEHAEDVVDEEHPAAVPLSETEWLASLKGTDGINPESNYEIYKRVTLEAGETPVSEAEWLLTIRGAAGDSAYEIAVKEGYEGTQAEWVASLKGKDGQNATVTILEGDTVVARVNADAIAVTGDDGRSAYQVAVDRGFIGDEDAWIASLKGEQGPTGPEGPQGIRGPQGEPGPAIAGFQVSKVFASTDDFEAADRFIKADGTSLVEGEFVVVVTEPPVADPENPEAEEQEGSNGAIYIVDSIPNPDDPDGDPVLQFNYVGSMSVSAEFQGPQGDKGETGDSVYDIYLAQFAEEHANDVVDEDHPAAVPLGRDAWLESMRGPQGPQGVAGPSAYDSAVTTGFTGTQEEWVASLQGKSAYQSYVDTFVPANPGDEPLTEAEWVESLSASVDPTTLADTESVTTLKRQVMRMSEIIQNYKALLEYIMMNMDVEVPAGLLPTDADIITYEFNDETPDPDPDPTPTTDPESDPETNPEEGE